MAQSSARRAALATMRAWRTEKRFAHLVIFKLLAKTKLSASDRAFALELFYGVLRNSTLLDFWIGRLRTAPVDIDLRDILRLGLYQLFILGTSEHAAVYETVELAQKRHRALINGILRAGLRRKDELRAMSCALKEARSPSTFEHLIRNFWSHAGNRISEPKPRKHCARGTTSHRLCMPGSTD
ncbi:MAG: hypothetical protein DMF46_04290 [Verrucomicrobia bacterium]|nr:MAG: hypothetical protein DMF46_04290 [Verrucomicrobiota bacterium]